MQCNITHTTATYLIVQITGLHVSLTTTRSDLLRQHWSLSFGYGPKAPRDCAWWGRAGGHQDQGKLCITLTPHWGVGGLWDSSQGSAHSPWNKVNMNYYKTHPCNTTWLVDSFPVAAHWQQYKYIVCFALLCFYIVFVITKEHRLYMKKCLFQGYCTGFYYILKIFRLLWGEHFIYFQSLKAIHISAAEKLISDSLVLLTSTFNVCKHMYIILW